VQEVAPPLIAFHVYVEFPAAGAEPWLVWIEAESAAEARAIVERDTKAAGGVVGDVNRADKDVGD
jgi:hypothetical protein